MIERPDGILFWELRNLCVRELNRVLNALPVLLRHPTIHKSGSPINYARSRSSLQKLCKTSQALALLLPEVTLPESRFVTYYTCNIFPAHIPAVAQTSNPGTAHAVNRMPLGLFFDSSELHCDASLRLPFLSRPYPRATSNIQFRNGIFPK